MNAFQSLYNEQTSCKVCSPNCFVISFRDSRDDPPPPPPPSPLVANGCQNTLVSFVLDKNTICYFQVYSIDGRIKKFTYAIMRDRSERVGRELHMAFAMSPLTYVDLQEFSYRSTCTKNVIHFITFMYIYVYNIYIDLYANIGLMLSFVKNPYLWNCPFMHSICIIGSETSTCHKVSQPTFILYQRRFHKRLSPIDSDFPVFFLAFDTFVAAVSINT